LPGSSYILGSGRKKSRRCGSDFMFLWFVRVPGALVKTEIKKTLFKQRRKYTSPTLII
jgi:hypothetical protein